MLQDTEQRRFGAEMTFIDAHGAKLFTVFHFLFLPLNSTWNFILILFKQEFFYLILRFIGSDFCSALYNFHFLTLGWEMM